MQQNGTETVFCGSTDNGMGHSVTRYFFGFSSRQHLFLEPPVEFKQEGKVWKLNRCIYGLADAPRAWYEKVVEELRDLGGVLSRYDQSLFLWHVNGSLDGIVVLHVDDFIYCGSDSWLVSVVMQIEEKFEVGRQSYNTFKYLGLMVKQNSEFITVDQQAYTESLKPLVISAERARQIDEPLTKNEVAQLKSLSGQILWASSQTRPDVAYDSCVVGNYGKEPTVRSLLRANKCIQKLQMTSVKLFFPKMRDISQVKVLTFADASHASLPSGASQGGLIVFYRMCWQGRSYHVAIQEIGSGGKESVSS